MTFNSVKLWFGLFDVISQMKLEEVRVYKDEKVKISFPKGHMSERNWALKSYWYRKSNCNLFPISNNKFSVKLKKINLIVLLKKK